MLQVSSASVARHLERVAETGAAPDDRLLVVVDVNVYLDLARLIGPAFSWNAFDALMEIQASEPNPHRSDARIDSLKAIASLRGRPTSLLSPEISCFTVARSNHRADTISVPSTSMSRVSASP